MAARIPKLSSVWTKVILVFRLEIESIDDCSPSTTFDHDLTLEIHLAACKLHYDSAYYQL